LVVVIGRSQILEVLVEEFKLVNGSIKFIYVLDSQGVKHIVLSKITCLLIHYVRAAVRNSDDCEFILAMV
jgi:hypothetical protein